MDESIAQARDYVKGLVGYTRGDPWLQSRLRIVLELLTSDAAEVAVAKEPEPKPKTRKAEAVR